ncbi:MAG: outer membrane lipoprotein carrier protein LolA [Burkholderiales bacterium]|nr:outer membrane lipoprotein carrier protein LolA [Burkholderiales bacterium]
MTSGKRSSAGSGAAAPAGSAGPGRRRFIAAAALAALWPVHERTSAQAGGASDRTSDRTPDRTFELEALMALLAQRKSGEARFTEERTVTGFDSPLRASGTLSFTAPDRFARQTLEPRRERMEVVGNQLRLERGGRVRQMALDAVPELAALVEGLRGTLAGNGALLRKHFDLRLAGQARLWTLTLVPRDPALAAQVRVLQIAGTAGEVRSVELQMAGDQRSLMSIEPVGAPAAAASR